MQWHFSKLIQKTYLCFLCLPYGVKLQQIGQMTKDTKLRDYTENKY